MTVAAQQHDLLQPSRLQECQDFGLLAYRIAGLRYYAKFTLIDALRELRENEESVRQHGGIISIEESLLRQKVAMAIYASEPLAPAETENIAQHACLTRSKFLNVSFW